MENTTNKINKLLRKELTIKKLYDCLIFYKTINNDTDYCEVIKYIINISLNEEKELINQLYLNKDNISLVLTSLINRQSNVNNSFDDILIYERLYNILIDKYNPIDKNEDIDYIVQNNELYYIYNYIDNPSTELFTYQCLLEYTYDINNVNSIIYNKNYNEYIKNKIIMNLVQILNGCEDELIIMKTNVLLLTLNDKQIIQEIFNKFIIYNNDIINQLFINNLDIKSKKLK